MAKLRRQHWQQHQVTGKRVAVKKVKDIFRDLGDAKRILRELKLLRHFRPHENVVTILDIMVHPGSSPDFRYVRTHVRISKRFGCYHRTPLRSRPVNDEVGKYLISEPETLESCQTLKQGMRVQRPLPV